VVGIKRHLFGRSSDPDHAGRPDPIRILTSLASGLGTLVVVIFRSAWPSGRPPDPVHSLVDRFIAASNTYQGLTVNAFNLWRNPFTGLGDVYRWGCDSLPPKCADGSGIAFVLGSTSVSWQLVGAALFGIAALVALWTVARRDDPAASSSGRWHWRSPSSRSRRGCTSATSSRRSRWRPRWSRAPGSGRPSMPS
jgi:hypothetical protein